jgi:hypothetical protein
MADTPPVGGAEYVVDEGPRLLRMDVDLGRSALEAA